MEFKRKEEFVQHIKQSILENLEEKSARLGDKVRTRLDTAKNTPIEVYFDKSDIMDRTSPYYDLPGQLHAVAQYVIDSLVTAGWSAELRNEHHSSGGFHPGMGGGPEYCIVIR